MADLSMGVYGTKKKFYRTMRVVNGTISGVVWLDWGGGTQSAIFPQPAVVGNFWTNGGNSP